MARCEGCKLSDPLLTRLERRREELMLRYRLIEAAGELDEPGGEIAFEALSSEMEFLRELHELLLLIALRNELSELTR